MSYPGLYLFEGTCQKPHVVMPASDRYSLICYCRAVEIVENSDELTADEALEALLARTALLVDIQREDFITVDQSTRIRDLDERLRNCAYKINKAIDLVSYRQNLSHSLEGWWWYLEQSHTVRWINRYDLFFSVLTFCMWTVSIALLIDLAGRFFSGGPDVNGLLAIILPSLLALITARDGLDVERKKLINSLLVFIKVPDFLQTKIRFLLTLLLFFFLLCLWNSLPIISKYYADLGLQHYRSDELHIAEHNYKRAIALHPGDGLAYYSLGRLYEDWLRFDDAKQFYQVAAGANDIRARNNLARLYILEGDHSKAVSLLVGSQKLLENQLALPKEFRSIFPEDQYNLLKNLGWVRFEQQENEKARNFLNRALDVYSDQGIPIYLENTASAHCILAQVLERQEEKGINEHWNLCRRLANSELPEEDAWLSMAEEYIKNAHGKDSIL